MTAIFARQGTVPGSAFGVSAGDLNAGEVESSVLSMEGFNQLTPHFETTLVTGSSATGISVEVEATEATEYEIAAGTAKWAKVPVNDGSAPPTVTVADGIWSRAQSVNTTEVWLLNIPCNYRHIKFKINAVGTTASGDVVAMLYARKGVI